MGGTATHMGVEHLKAYFLGTARAPLPLANNAKASGRTREHFIGVTGSLCAEPNAKLDRLRCEANETTHKLAGAP